MRQGSDARVAIGTQVWDVTYLCDVLLKLLILQSPTNMFCFYGGNKPGFTKYTPNVYLADIRCILPKI